MVQAIISAEVMGVLISLIMIYGNRYEVKQKNQTRQVFSVLMEVNLIAMIADLLSWVLDGSIEYQSYTYVFTLLSTVLSFAVSAIYMLYIYVYISARRSISNKIFKAGIYYSFIAMFVVAIACLKGYIISFENGYYQEGTYYDVYVFAHAICLLAVSVVTISSVKYLGMHDAMAVLSYIILVLISMTINIFNPDFSMIYPTITIVLLIAYIMLQAEHENVLIKQELVTAHRAMHDELTGLLNRRAYTEVIDSMKGKANVGVIFCDINGLKYTNDNMGHEAGDHLLMDLSVLLQTIFRKEEIFRISGDEFVVILPEIREAVMEDRYAQLKKKLLEYTPTLAAVGTAYGKMEDVVNIMKRAEKQMYIDKEECYKRYPEYKR